MGFPKYFEDNDRIRDERFFMRGATENCCIINIEIYKKIYEHEKQSLDGKKKKIDIIRLCKDCGREFIISSGEQDFYNKKGLCIPKRCKDCREKRKNQ